MEDEEIRETYGTVTLSPEGAAAVGSYGTWTLEYTVGAIGMDDGSTLKVAMHITSSWGPPQFDDPTADGYSTVETSGEASVEGRFDSSGHVRPWSRAVIVDVFDGAIAEGDTITITLGDTRAGSMGLEVQPFPEEGFAFVPFVDPLRSGEFVRLPADLTLDVIPGRGERLRALAPSDTSPDEPVEVGFRIEDRWGNVARGESGTAEFESDRDATVPETVTYEGGVGRAPVAFAEPGVHRVTVRDDDGRTATTNPIECGGAGPPTYWGDPHGQSEETVGTGSITDYFEFARDDAFLDFAAHAANDFQITDDLWETIQASVGEFHDPGSFVTFLAYEWSANTPNGGDHNVYFRGDEAEIRRSSGYLIDEGPERGEGTYPVEALYETYRGRDDVLIIPHQGGRPATLEAMDDDLSPFVEIVSVWGVFEWLGREALERGYAVGFGAGSDDHTGRPGAAYPTNREDFNIKGGLMAARADGLDRDALWEAFTDRRIYATTGARILLDVSAAGAGMGESVETRGAPEIEASVRATAPISRIELLRGGTVIEERDLTAGEDRVEFAWNGARSRTRHKVKDWSGGLSLSRGRIGAVDEFGFDYPEHGVRHRTDTTVRWSGGTSGNHQGVRLDLDAPRDARVSFNTPAISDDFRLSGLDAPRVVECDGPECRLSVRRVGEATTLDADVAFEDDPGPGTHPYYVRVHQADGEMAWSSPAFVTVE